MYNGKLLLISVKGDKAKIKYTDNSIPEGLDESVPKTITVEVDRGISDKFANIFRSFLGHGLFKMGLLCSNLDEKAMKSRKCVDMPEFKNFSVTSLKFSGDDENSAISIGLSWECPDGEVVAINCPAIKYMNGGYAYEDFLNDDIANIELEAKSYLEGKNYYGQQLNIFEEEQF